MLAQPVVHFCRVNKKACVASIIKRGEGQSDRGLSEVSASSVQQPSDCVWLSEHNRAFACFAQLAGNLVAFVGARFACKRNIVWDHRIGRGSRAVGPNVIHEVFAGLQSYARACEPFNRCINIVFGVQPWIKADHITVFSRAGEPVSELGLGPIDGSEMGRIHLVADLQLVTPIYENASSTHKGDTESCRACESSEPFKSRIAISHVFALVRVSSGDNVPVKSSTFHGVA